MLLKAPCLLVVKCKLKQFSLLCVDSEETWFFETWFILNSCVDWSGRPTRVWQPLVRMTAQRFLCDRWLTVNCAQLLLCFMLRSGSQLRQLLSARVCFVCSGWAGLWDHEWSVLDDQRPVWLSGSRDGGHLWRLAVLLHYSRWAPAKPHGPWIINCFQQLSDVLFVCQHMTKHLADDPNQSCCWGKMHILSNNHWNQVVYYWCHEGHSQKNYFC